MLYPLCYRRHSQQHHMTQRAREVCDLFGSYCSVQACTELALRRRSKACWQGFVGLFPMHGLVFFPRSALSHHAALCCAARHCRAAA